MSRKQKKILWPVASLVVATLAIAFISVRAGSSDAKRARAVKPAPLALATPAPQSQGKSKTDLRALIARQPAALKLAMQLGKRFRNADPSVSVLNGILHVGTDEQKVRITRRQTASGEEVEIALGTGPASLTWSPEDGVKSSRATPTDSDKKIVECLVADTPDQFILAQLRGASYQVIGRNVRPVGAGDRDDYKGPVWDIIRIGEPAVTSSASFQSPQRFYWINVQTGLIDRIKSFDQGTEVVATITWAEQGTEKVPSRITWTEQGQTLMQLDFNGFNYSTGRQ